MQVRTATEAILYTNSSLVKIKKEQGELSANAFISFILTDLVMSFNVGKTMNEAQIIEATKLLQQDYYFLKPSELKYCFNNAKMGKYGQLYDRIDMAVIFGWIEKYLEERIEIVVLENKNKNNEYNSGLMHESVAESLKSVFVEEIKPVVKPTQREWTEREKIVQDIFKEFDLLHREKPYKPNESLRMVSYNGQELSQDEYLLLRINELGLNG